MLANKLDTLVQYIKKKKDEKHHGFKDEDDDLIEKHNQMEVLSRQLNQVQSDITVMRR